MEPTKQGQYPLCLSIGQMKLGLLSEIQLKTLTGTTAFLCNGQPEALVKILFADKLLEIKGESCGEDDLFSYYQCGEQFCSLAKPGTDGSVSLASYPSDFQQITLYIDEKTFSGVIRTADKVLQLLPMKQLLAYHKSFLLHSSRIHVKGRAILFTAPSQTGKTTQARLWEKYAGAKVVGNDRTLLWQEGNCILTSGYPVDGSNPVYSSEKIPLGAVVVLRQGAENQVERLGAVTAFQSLMGQTALDAWSMDERSAAQQFWLEVLSICPVYLLSCRPDEGAVLCLKDQLEKDEVIPCGKHTP